MAVRSWLSLYTQAGQNWVFSMYLALRGEKEGPGLSWGWLANRNSAIWWCILHRKAHRWCPVEIARGQNSFLSRPTRKNWRSAYRPLLCMLPASSSKQRRKEPKNSLPSSTGLRFMQTSKKPSSRYECAQITVTKLKCLCNVEGRPKRVVSYYLNSVSIPGILSFPLW